MDVRCVLVVLLALFGMLCYGGGPEQPTQLLVEYRPSPALGVDVAKPRFSWALTHTSRGQMQMAYELLVSSSSACSSGDMWYSGVVHTAQQSQVEYNGSTLAADTSYYWKIRWWSTDEQVSEWSPVATFHTGLLTASDWSAAQWIGGAHQLRTEFSVATSNIKYAHLFICGLGFYVARLNGQRVGDSVLGTFTTFERTLLYDTYDVTHMLQSENALAVELGHGWYSQSSVNVGDMSLACLINVVYQDGTRVTVGNTNGFWRTIDGPVVADDIYYGMTYDARSATPGWDLYGYNVDSWGWAKVYSDHEKPTGTLKSQLIQPIKKLEEYRPVQITEPAPNVYVLDFGQNIAGWSHLKMCGTRGKVVTVMHSEMLGQNGKIVNMYSNSPMTDTYILDGTYCPEEFEPYFTYHSFQYVQIEGFPGVPSSDSVWGYFIHTALPETGSITVDNDVINQVQHLTVYAALSNWYNIPTDCPQRERRGWLGDAQLASETEIFNFDMSAAYTKFMYDILDQQEFSNVGGEVADCVPFYDHGSIPADPAWGTAYTLIWYWMYKYYGDTRMLSQYYDGVKLYIDSLITESEPSTGLLEWSRYGDWCSVANTGEFQNDCGYPQASVSAFYYILELQTFARVAGMLNNTADQENYSQLAAAALQSFQSHFFNSATYTYDVGYQTQQVLALELGVVPDDQLDNVINELIGDIVNDHDTHLDTGIVGTKYILPVLSAIGRTDLAFDIAQQTTYPSWGYWLTQGATTLWENWQSTRYTAYGSRNHIMFGGHGPWYYQVLAGINMADDGVAWDKIRIAPQVEALGYMDHASASISTHRGLVESAWWRYNPMCGQVEQYNLATFECLEGLITSVNFASFGQPTGYCGNFAINSDCHASKSQEVVEGKCLNTTVCSVEASDLIFGDPCIGKEKWLYIQLGGCPYTALQMTVQLPANTYGTIEVPTLGLSDVSVLEGTSTVWQKGEFIASAADGLTGATQTTSSIIFNAGSGSYNLHLKGTLGPVVSPAPVPAGSRFHAACPKGYHISAVRSASFGSAGTAKRVVERKCLGKESCTIKHVKSEMFGLRSVRECNGGECKLQVQLACAK